MRTAFVVLVILGIACAGGGSDGGTKPGSGPGPGDVVTLDASTHLAYCRSREALRLAKRMTCDLATAAYVQTWAAEVPTECLEIDAFVAAGRIVYSPQAGEACLRALEAASCDGLKQAALAEPACRAAITGTVAPNGTCRIEEECLGGRCHLTSGCSGWCVADLAEGEPCMWVTGECGPGLWCDAVGGSCVRQAPGAVGAPCDGAEPECDVGLYCDDGICRAKLVAGENCSYTIDACAQGSMCASGAYGSSTCVPYAALGEACDPLSSWPWCAPGTHCQGTSGTCEADALPGGSCTGSGDCLKGYCDYATARCVALKAEGTPCAAHRECATGVCGSASLVCISYESACAP